MGPRLGFGDRVSYRSTGRGRGAIPVFGRARSAHAISPQSSYPLRYGCMVGVLKSRDVDSYLYSKNKLTLEELR
jgi:hypothetical protein